MLRRLRIAASVFCGVLTIAVIALWVRSHRHIDLFVRDTPTEQQIKSVRGQIQLTRGYRPIPGAISTAWHHDTLHLGMRPGEKSPPWTLRFPRVTQGMNMTVVSVPYWLATVLFAVLAVVPVLSMFTWTRLRFTTRTLLIATMLVAVLLGATAWIAK